MSTQLDEYEEFMNEQDATSEGVTPEVTPADGDFELEMFLSSDGKHTVRIATKNKSERNIAIPYAKALYKKILAEFGTKQGQAVKEYNRPAPNSTTEANLAPQNMCPIHKVPMQQFTKNGQSWFSHNSDNVWCNGKRSM